MLATTIGETGIPWRIVKTYALESSLGSSVGLLGALGGGYMRMRISNRSYSELAKSAAA